jgi:hypothetical protein
MSEPTTFPSAAQIARNKTEVESAVRLAVHKMQLRVKAIELASQFPASDPIKLAREIFSFITEGGDDF